MSATSGVLERVRTSCADVAAASTLVRIEPDAVAPLAELLAAEAAAVASEPMVDPRDREGVIALQLALATINFGSGWHPVVRKRPGCSGAVTMAAALQEEADRSWPLTGGRLRGFTPAEAHRVFGQPTGDPAVAELMGHFADALVELGGLVGDRYGDSFTALLDDAVGSADRLVGILGALPHFADEATHPGSRGGERIRVAFYKRAQLAAADLDRALPGRVFDDLDRLTAFADNLVPHVLRLDGVLTYDPKLLAAIDAGALLPAGGQSEVEIRANGVHAVELLREALAEQGVEVRSSDLDLVLWRRGGRPEAKAVPRHRTRSVFY